MRAYNTEPQVWGGDENCDHEWATEAVKTELGKGNWAQGTNGRGELQPGGVTAKREPIRGETERAFCLRCNAWRGELGQENSVALYVAHLVEVFAAVRRVLRKDGVLMVNLGDSYCGGGGYSPNSPSNLAGSLQSHNKGSIKGRGNGHAGLKPKDLMLVPDRFRIAMQEDGWWVRSKMPWLKRSCMPESVDGSHYGQHQIGVKAWERLTGMPFLVPDGEDIPNRVDCPGCPKCAPNGGLVLSMSAGRPTSAVEDVILFTKSGTYFWDAIAVQRSASQPFGQPRLTGQHKADAGGYTTNGHGPSTLGTNQGASARNMRNADLFFDSLGPLLGAADEPEPTPRQGKRTWGERKARGEATRRGETANRTFGGHVGIGDRSHAGPPFPPQGLILDEDGDPLALDVNPAGYDGAHFATFPSKLVRPLILAGTSERGCCPKCLAPWVRVVERVDGDHESLDRPKAEGYLAQGMVTYVGKQSTLSLSGGSKEWERRGPRTATTGWLPSCRCPDPGPPVPCTLLDPFAGSGTALMEANRLGRDAVGIDLNDSYALMSHGRLVSDAPLFVTVETSTVPEARPVSRDSQPTLLWRDTDGKGSPDSPCRDSSSSDTE